MKETDSSNPFIQWDVSRARCHPPPQKIESSSPKCKQGGQLVACGPGTNSMLSQPIALLASWKHSWQISNIAKHTAYHVGLWKIPLVSANGEEFQITRWSNYGKKQPEKHNIHLAQIFFVHLSAGSTETSNRRDNGVKIFETVLHCNKDAFDTAWRWYAKCEVWLLVLAVHMHPSHWCVEAPSNTSIGNLLGLWDWVLKIFVFRTLNCSPTWAKRIISSSSRNCVSSNVFAKRRISSANLRSMCACHPENPHQHYHFPRLSEGHTSLSTCRPCGHNRYIVIPLLRASHKLSNLTLSNALVQSCLFSDPTLSMQTFL